MDQYCCHHHLGWAHGCHSSVRKLSRYLTSFSDAYRLHLARWKHRKCYTSITRARGVCINNDSEWFNRIDSLCRWLGLILLLIVSFAADGAIAILYFFRSIYHHYFQTPIEPISLAKARAIDLSVQFALFWMPVFVLIAWWSHKPLSLLFDLFEVAVLVGSIFLVNYVTADGKTNWAEGCAMVGFYAIIVSVSFSFFLVFVCPYL